MTPDTILSVAISTSFLNFYWFWFWNWAGSKFEHKEPSRDMRMENLLAKEAHEHWIWQSWLQANFLPSHPVTDFGNKFTMKLSPSHFPSICYATSHERDMGRKPLFTYLYEESNSRCLSKNKCWQNSTIYHSTKTSEIWSQQAINTLLTTTNRWHNNGGFTWLSSKTKETLKSQQSCWLRAKFWTQGVSG